MRVVSNIISESKAQRSHTVNKWLISYIVVCFYLCPSLRSKVYIFSPFGIYSETKGLLNLIICPQSLEGAFPTVQVILMHTKVKNHCTRSLCISWFPGLLCSFNTSLLFTDSTLILHLFLVNLRTPWNHMWYLNIGIQRKNIVLLSYFDFEIVLFFYNWNKCFYHRNKFRLCCLKFIISSDALCYEGWDYQFWMRVLSWWMVTGSLAFVLGIVLCAFYTLFYLLFRTTLKLSHVMPTFIRKEVVPC